MATVIEAPAPSDRLLSLIEDVRELQQQRVTTHESRNRLDARLTATVATAIGYHVGLPRSERAKLLGDAKKLIREVPNPRRAPR